ncbi:hypothetical protein GDO86_019537 [Hymenochirus boettgeri]|uniref:2',5'-phosphodiesterase 12 n=1 Tax=Hymenochirus boettgeri TaxID=247094 RepID=A0A8T2IGQ6_9PIPI|nr:hypothetical protein GDO86_019537 [Hymenochirus boettgeri]
MMRHFRSLVSLRVRSVPGMERAVVRVLPGDSRVTIALRLIGIRRNLQRDRTELLGRTLTRIAATASKKVRGKEPGGEVPGVRLWYQGREVPGDEPNCSAWREGSVLEVGQTRYLVERNPPSFLQLELPRSVLVGSPLSPRVQVEFGTIEASEFVWYRQAGDSTKDEARDGWEEVGRGRVFTPGKTELGKRLKLMATPGDGHRQGPAVQTELTGPVEDEPCHCLSDPRHLLTQSPAALPGFRTVSYNILADIYAQTELSRTALYPYCPDRALERGYRQNLLRREVTGYRADLLCLQEVERETFEGSLGSVLGATGLDGTFRVKEKQHEGLATFYRRDRFRLVSQHDVTLAETLREDPVQSDLRHRLAGFPAVWDSVMRRSTALQVLVLESTDNPARKLCLANTHLYFHPNGGNIRLIQMTVALTHLRHVACELYPGIPVVFCGDFNSMPNSGIYRFVTSGSISEDHEDWTSNGEEEQCNMALTHPFKLASACGTPDYTNYIGDFNGCLDYIFIDSLSLDVERIIPLPSHEEVIRHKALPSVSHPSDHLALVCDLKWK